MKKILVFLIALLLTVAASNQVPRRVELTSTNSTILRTDFSPTSVARVVAQIRALDAIQEAGPIYLVLSTPGGQVGPGLELVRVCNGTRRGVVTITINAASMGFVLVQLNRGQRLLVEGGQLMMHQISTVIQGDRHTLHDRLRELDQLHDFVTRRILERSKMSQSDYDGRVDHEYYCVDSVCTKEGFADEVVSPVCSAKSSVTPLFEVTASRNAQQGLVELVEEYSSCALDTLPKRQFIRVAGKEVPIVVTPEIIRQIFGQEHE